jgi:hypothetical protein
MPDLTYISQIIFEGVVIGFFSIVVFELFLKIRKTSNALSLKLALWLFLYVVSMIIGFLSQINGRIFDNGLFPRGYTDIFRLIYLILVPVANFIAYLYYIDFYRVLFNRSGRIRSFLFLTLLVLSVSVVIMFFPSYRYLGNIVMVIHALYLYLPSFWRCADDFAKFEDRSEILNQQERIQQIEQEIQTGNIEELRYSLLSRAIVYLCFLIYALFFVFDGIWDYLTGGYYGPFFYFAWVTMIICSLFMYFAFVNPGRFLEILKKYRVSQGISD